MKDTRPLSERFDLTYVGRRHFADRVTGRLGLLLALVTAGFMGVMAFRHDETAYSAGPLSRVHDMFASQCGKCHAPDAAHGKGYFLPPSDEQCLACHAGQATLHAQDQIDLFTMSVPGHPDLRTSANCTACHFEHQGRNVDISQVPDSFCVRCHEDLSAKGIRLEPIKTPSKPGPSTGDASPDSARKGDGQ